MTDQYHETRGWREEAIRSAKTREGGMNHVLLALSLLSPTKPSLMPQIMTLKKLYSGRLWLKRQHLYSTDQKLPKVATEFSSPL